MQRILTEETLLKVLWIKCFLNMQTQFLLYVVSLLAISLIRKVKSDSFKRNVKEESAVYDKYLRSKATLSWPVSCCCWAWRSVFQFQLLFFRFWALHFEQSELLSFELKLYYQFALLQLYAESLPPRNLNIYFRTCWRVYLHINNLFHIFEQSRLLTETVPSRLIIESSRLVL